MVTKVKKRLSYGNLRERGGAKLPQADDRSYNSNKAYAVFGGYNNSKLSAEMSHQHWLIIIKALQ